MLWRDYKPMLEVPELEPFDFDQLRADLAELTEESKAMDTMDVVNEVMTNNQADLQPIIAQCGGALQFMSLLPHLEAVVKTSQAAADPATAVDDVVKHNEQSIRVIFQMLGGLDGLLKLEPNFTNIYRTVEKTGHPLHTLMKDAAKLKPEDLQATT